MIKGRHTARDNTNTSRQHSFARTPQVQMQRSVFDRSCGLKTTLPHAGILYPIFLDEALPGDTIVMHAALFARVATLIQPIMENVYLDTFFFAVPMRLVWENFQKFMGEQDNPGDSIDFLIPELDKTTIPDQATRHPQLWNWMGLPSQFDETAVEAHISALPFRCHNLIYNEWFRDQNLQNSKPKNVDDGPDDYTDYELYPRGKRSDYFTRALTSPQKGDAVTLPLGSEAPVIASATGIPLFNHGAVTLDELQVSAGGDNGKSVVMETASTPDFEELHWSSQTGLVADLSSATSATINAIRQAFQIQKLLERDARGGTRYTELIKSHFGVSSDDSRLQRPEYLGGGSSLLSINPVAQSVRGAVGVTSLAELGAFGVTLNETPAWTKSFTEHCYVIGYASVRADLNYQEGLEKLWTRRTKYDFFWPALAHLGEQAVLNYELHNNGTSTDYDVWGYQGRYDEYRYKSSKITGDMKSEAPESLDVWHLAQDFGATRPLLNASFIEENPPFERIIAIVDAAHFLLDGGFNYHCVRPMPMNGVPGMVDHF